MATIIEINTEKKLKSLNKINSSSLITKANQVHIAHNTESLMTAMACFE